MSSHLNLLRKEQKLCGWLLLALLIKALIFAFFEHRYAAWFLRIRHMIGTAIRISKDNLDELTNQSFVIMSSSKVKYDPLWLGKFKFHLEAAAVRPHLEYCQWKCYAFNHSTHKCKSGYSLVWDDSYMIHLEYDIWHQNPLLLFAPKIPLLYSQPFKIGQYNINPDLVAEASLTRLPVIPENALLNFSQSSLYEDNWRSVGRGWLLHQYGGGKPRSFTESRSFWSHFSNPFVMSPCIPGSMRIEFQVFDSSVVTALGYRQGNLLSRGDFEGAKMGLIAAGWKSTSEILQPKFNAIWWVTWIVRVLAIVAVFGVIMIFVDDIVARRFIITGELLLGITITCSQWSSMWVTGIVGFGSIATLGRGFYHLLKMTKGYEECPN